MFYDTKTLIVVYKDEMLVNQLKKLIETNDDTQDGNVVGTRDESIKIVSWTEKVWLNNKKAGNIDSKVLFLGDIKGVDKLIPVLDLKFDDFGVKYGWAGDQAALYVDPKELKDHNTYLAFLNKISGLAIPDVVKNANKPKSEEKAEMEREPIIEEAEIVAPVEEGKDAPKKAPAFFLKAKEAIAKGLDSIEDTIKKAGNDVNIKAQDLFRDNSAVTRQMLFYGIINLYNQDLDAFVRS